MLRICPEKQWESAASAHQLESRADMRRQGGACPSMLIFLILH
jgi:hypothetical protein